MFDVQDIKRDTLLCLFEIAQSHRSEKVSITNLKKIALLELNCGKNITEEILNLKSKAQIKLLMNTQLCSVKIKPNNRRRCLKISFFTNVSIEQ